jgi:hypothetical protein
MSLFDPDQDNKVIDWMSGEHPARGNAIIGVSPTNPRVVIEARGGHDFFCFCRQSCRRKTLRIGPSTSSAGFSGRTK